MMNKQLFYCITNNNRFRFDITIISLNQVILEALPKCFVCEQVIIISAVLPNKLTP